MYFLTSTIESYQEVSPFLSAGNVPTCNSCNYLECITATLSHRYLQKFSTIHIRCILFLHIKDTVKLYLKFQKSNKNELLQSLHPYRNLGEKNVSCTTLRRWAASRVIEKQGFSFTGNARFSISKTKIWKYQPLYKPEIRLSFLLHCPMKISCTLQGLSEIKPC